MIRAVVFSVFFAGISAQMCIPPDVVHTETGDDLYRALLCDLNNVENMAAQISATAQGACTKFEDIDFFSQLLITISADNAWLDKLGAGTSIPSGNECIGVNTRIDFDLTNIQRNSNTPIASAVCPPVSGQALSQYTLQQFGKTLAALDAAPAGPTPMGKWQKYVQDLKNGIAAVQADIHTADDVNCVAATKTLANALVGIRSSCTGTSHYRGLLRLITFYSLVTLSSFWVP